MTATVKVRLNALLMLAAALTAVGVGGDAQADPPASFGPIESRAFAWKPGTAIERPADSNCNSNSDWFVIRGPNLANVKTIDVSPKVSAWDRQMAIPAVSTCAAGDNNCMQIFVKVTKQDAPGARTVTL